LRGAGIGADHSKIAEIELLDSGEFTVAIRHANLLGVDSSKLGDIQLNIDSINAAENVSLQCHERICTLDEHKSHDHEICDHGDDNWH
jgi:hypothetical protein